MTDVGGPSPLEAASSLSMGLRIKKLAEHEAESKPQNKAKHHPSMVLDLSSCSDSPQWQTVIWNSKLKKPFPPQGVFDVHYRSNRKETTTALLNISFNSYKVRILILF